MLTHLHVGTLSAVVGWNVTVTIIKVVVVCAGGVLLIIGVGSVVYV
jgi:hypothetical protein